MYYDCSLEIKQVFQPLESDIIYAVGFVGSSQFSVYQLSYKSGEVLKHNTASFPGGFCGEASLVSSDMLVALDATRSFLILISFQSGIINFHQTYISDLVQDFSGMAELLPVKFTGMFGVKTVSSIYLVRVKGVSELDVIEKFNHPASVSDVLILSEEQQAFAIVQHAQAKINFKVKLDTDIKNDVLKETIEVDPQRGHVQKVFINNYVRTDKSHGFRALIVMEDHSLLLVQQGEVVWSREDGLASIIDSTTSELPVEKEGVSVAVVEHNLFEWLKVLFLFFYTSSAS